MSEFKSGFVTLVGVPNAGKSSLVNALVGESVSIVTAKPQTTRFKTLGISTEKDHQIIWVDTPGVVDTKKGLNPILRDELNLALKNVDAIVATIAPWELNQMPWVHGLWEKIKDRAVLIVTQSDKISLEDRAKFLIKGQEIFGRQPLFTSSVTGHGVDDLRAEVLKHLKPGPRFYDDEIYTTQTMREMAGEVVRKFCFEFLHQEIPYGLTVIVQEFKEGPIVEIAADILVSKSSHKGMVIGQGGSVLKNIGTRARTVLEKQWNSKVFLKLHVVVRENWIHDKSILRESGFKNA